MNIYRRLVSRYLGPQRVAMLGLSALLVLNVSLDLVNPQLLRAFIDNATVPGAMPTLVWLAGGFLAIAVVLQLISLAEIALATNIGLVATNRLRADLAYHCLRLDPAFYNAHPPGELIERVDGDVGTLANFFSRFMVYLLGNALLLLGLLVLAFQLDWRVGLSLMVLALLTLTLLIGLRGMAEPHWDGERQAHAELYGFIEERLSGTEDIRANGATAYVMRRLFEHARRVFGKQLTASAFGISTGAITVMMLALSTAVSLGIGAYLYFNGQLSLGDVYLIFTYTTLLSRPVEQISRQIQDLQKAAASIGRIQKLFAVESQIVEAPQPMPLPNGPLAVAFDHVSFNYDPNVRTLHNVQLHLAPGRVLGLLGRTGSGKTTLTRLLFRLYDPTAGVLRLGGVDLRAASLDDIRRRVGMVTQEIQLFHASVRDNLTFFDTTIPDAQIKRVLEELGLSAWLGSLKEGLDTLLAPGGSGLSAGEAQLLAFARVFLRDPGLVILDEASSRLDPATEQRLERAIDRLLQNRTAIIIAHRLSTVQRADEILILEAGEIAEHGARAALAADAGSRFAQLLKTGLEAAGSEGNKGKERKEMDKEVSYVH